MASAQQVPSAQQKRFMDLYRQGQIKDALREAERLTPRYPHDAFAWKALGNCLLQLGDFAEAAAALETAFHLTPEDPLVLNAFSRACFHTNRLDKGLELQKKSLELEPDNAQGHYNMASMLHQSGSSQGALQHLAHAEEQGFDNAQILSMRSIVLSLSFRFKEGLDELLKLYELKPNDPTVHNSLGNYYKDMADFAKAEAHYQKAKALAPKYAMAYSNEILARHYNPASTVADILETAQEWHRQFACQAPYTHTSDPSASGGKLRIGIVSGSLRMHPVGWMITNALSNLPEDIELYVYSDSEPSDFIAQRIQQTATQWQPIYHLDQQQVAEHIHGDQIHILIDLAGHGSNSRLPAIVMKPAPLIIKWVGMQISSMGIPEFDYFLSDSIETPPGVDDQYTEKLIRLPNDYVCYYPPYYKPAIAALPAISNGYITLGCFNNPAKVNDVVLREWANLMHELPNSHLLLKGGQYSSPEVCERIRNLMANAGISDERLILEGPSKHQELLESYHRVDIALDPWPYSGGLTTCEAMLMGVPVVTLPGPTFAGRHSATHLTNAGMQELVVSSWEEYRQRVIELASDLPSLALIRAALRTYLEQSPVCDGERFARHLHKALRAIWQRYCEGKPPAALTFNKGGQAWFEDDSSPVKLPTELQRGFDWDLESPVMILDNGAGIAMRSDARELLGSGNIAVLVFDPLHALGNAEELAQYGEIQHFPQVTLGNGRPATLRGVEGENDITSLKPLVTGTADSLQTLEIPSIALDSIEGLESLDVLALDDRHDNLAILEHGTKALEKALLLQIRVRFNPTHEGQADLGSLTRWASEHGFRFYRLHNAEYRSHLPDDAPAELKQASELVSADALFLPNAECMKTLSRNQRARLAFLLHTVYKITDITFEILNAEDKKASQMYLEATGMIPQNERYNTDSAEHINSSNIKSLEGVNLHIMPVEKFTTPFIDFVKNRIPESKNHYLLFGSEPSHSAPQQDDIEYFRHGSTQLLAHMKSAKRIFFHGLWIEQAYSILTEFQDLYSKSYLFMWGGDYYYPEKHSEIKKEVIKNIGFLMSSIPEDVAYIRKHYNAKGVHLFGKGYPVGIKRGSSLKAKRHKTVNILLGNSAFETNNHKEAIEKLSQHKLKKVNIYCPLSYGDRDYALKTTEYGKKILGKKFHPMFSFLSPHQYDQFLEKIDIAVYNHTRQQAYTTTLSLLSRGVKIYLNSDSVVYRKLKEVGAHVFDIDDFSLSPMSLHEMMENQRIAMEQASDEVVECFLRSHML